MDRLLDKHLMLLIYLLNNSQSIMFAKTNGSTVGETPCMLFDTHLLQIFPQLCLLRQMDRRLD